MIQKIKKYKGDPNKNYYLVMGILILFLVFMIGTVLMVTNQVGKGSSAEMLKERLSKQSPKEKKLTPR